jgi:hypothetical protein
MVYVCMYVMYTRVLLHTSLPCFNKAATRLTIAVDGDGCYRCAGSPTRSWDQQVSGCQQAKKNQSLLKRRGAVPLRRCTARVQRAWACGGAGVLLS